MMPSCIRVAAVLSAAISLLDRVADGDALVIEAPSSNLFAPDSVLAVLVDGSDILRPYGHATLSRLVLAKVSILWFRPAVGGAHPVLRDFNPSFDRYYYGIDNTVAGVVALPLNCTLPLAGPHGTGALTLSADGRFTTLACYGHAPGTPLVGATEAVLAAIGADGSIDVATRMPLLSGEHVFSAVTDDGSSFWLATSTGVYSVAYGSTGARGLLVYGGVVGGTIRQVSIADGSTLWVSDVAAESVMAVSGRTAASNASYPFAGLPRSVADVSAAKPLLRPPFAPSPSVCGHALLLQPRGQPAPGVYAGERMSNAQLPCPANVSGPLAIAALGVESQSVLRVNSGEMRIGWSAVAFEPPVSAGSFAFPNTFQPGAAALNGSRGEWLPTQNLALDSQADVCHVAAVASRTVDDDMQIATKISDIPDIMRIVGTVYASTGYSILNHTLVLQQLRYGKAATTHTLYALPRYYEHVMRFAGVSIAPYVTGLPPPSPMPPLPPEPSPSASVSETAAPTASVSRSAAQAAGAGASAAFTPSPSATASRLVDPGLDAGPIRGPSFDFASQRNVGDASGSGEGAYLLLLRMGGTTGSSSSSSSQAAAAATATATATPASAPASASPSRGSAAIAGGASRSMALARPLFVDGLEGQTGEVLGTVSMPATTADLDAAPGHRRCVGAFTSLEAKLRMSWHDAAFAALPCFDAEAGVDLLQLGYDRDAAALAGATIASAPPAVIARFLVTGNVDTRTLLSSPAAGAGNCSFAVPTGISLLPPEADSPGFFVASRPLAGAPPAAERACGIRLVKLWNNGTSDKLLPADHAEAPHQAAFLLSFVNKAFGAWSNARELVGMYCFGCKGRHNGELTPSCQFQHVLLSCSGCDLLRRKRPDIEDHCPPSFVLVLYHTESSTASPTASCCFCPLCARNTNLQPFLDCRSGARQPPRASSS